MCIRDSTDTEYIVEDRGFQRKIPLHRNEVLMDRNFIAVSYTHLVAVMLSRRMSKLLSVIRSNNSPAASIICFVEEAVSYTHLDVYKRQIYRH